MGERIGSALEEYFDLLFIADRNRFEKRQARKKEK